ncbi:acyl-CoA carboxylase subunit beta [Pseudooceanicola aestuarii]|uniref:acyl-CoA carboxylase subunit beta n=1 Tax=Pseudooceanicola aestuarii TaxID=2697319 RepID=UPI001952F412|nr:carboxyl transferase domain-containing protein [Pseudooceanicola aestuarii]
MTDTADPQPGKAGKFRDHIADHTRRTEQALSMGGPAKLDKRRAEGHMNARERIDTLLDTGTFTESGLFNTSMQPQDADRTPADGKVAGFGRIDTRRVAVISNDFTVKGASSSPVNTNKMEHVKKVAGRNGFPVVFLGESTGARMPDIMGAKNIIGVNNNPAQYMRLRDNPWAAAVLGHCFGSATWYSAMSDFMVMRKGACLAVSSPRLISMATRQKVEFEDLGGWRLHTEVTGLADLAVDTDAEALTAIRSYLSYLPSHANEAPPRVAVPEGSETQADDLLDVIPEGPGQVYDVKQVIRRIVDRDSLFELKARFAKSLVTGLARIDGRSVGIMANNPIHKGGAIDAEACDKAISFLVHCDSYNIPLVFLVDQPGFLIGVEAERKKMPGKVMNWLNALALVTVPKFSVIMRKSYGLAVRNMGGSNNADEVAAWWTAEVSFMDPRSGVSVVHGLAPGDDGYSDKLAEMSRDTSAYDLGAVNGARAVIDPRGTRAHLAEMLDIYNDGLRGGIGQHHLRNWPTAF